MRESAMSVRLTICSGALSGIIVQMEHSKFLIGRGKDCLLRPSSPTVSRHHCLLNLDDAGLRVQDLESTNGTFVNGRRIQGEAVLKQNDMITVGEVTIRVDLSLQRALKSAPISASETIMRCDESTVEFPVPEAFRKADPHPAPAPEDASQR